MDKKKNYLFQCLTEQYSTKVRECIFNAIECLPLKAINFVVKNCVFIVDESSPAFALCKVGKRDNIVFVCKEVFEKESREVCVKIILHELGHVFVKNKMLYFKGMKLKDCKARAVAEQKFCDEFAKNSYVILGNPKNDYHKRLGVGCRE